MCARQSRLRKFDFFDCRQKSVFIIFAEKTVPEITWDDSILHHLAINLVFMESKGDLPPS